MHFVLISIFMVKIMIVTFFIGLVGYLVFAKIRDCRLLKSVTGLHRGTKSERALILKLLKYGIHPKAIFHDLYVKKIDGSYSQIDLVVATKVGMLIFEVKDYSGWLFGNGTQRQWTQVLAYGKEKYRFYNPVMQNNKHISNLRKQLRQFENVPFYSIIVFYGNCTLKEISSIPNETFLVYSQKVIDVVSFIVNNNEPVKYADKQEVVWLLSQSAQNGDSIETRMKHIQDIQDVHWRNERN